MGSHLASRAHETLLPTLLSGLVLLSLLHLLLLALPARAQSGITVSGMLEESWRRGGLMTGDSSAIPSQADFTQNYELRLDGSILTPNFITWRLGTGLRDQRLDADLARYHLRRFKVCDLRLDILRARPLAYEIYVRQDLQDLETRVTPRTRQAELTLETGVRLARPGWPVTRAGWQLHQSRRAGRLEYRNQTGTLELRSSGPHSEVDISFRDDHRRERGRSRVQELRLRGSSRLWNESTAVTGEVRARQEARARELHNTLHFNGRWREKDRLNLALGSVAQYLWSSSRHNLRAQGDYRRQLAPRWNALTRGDFSSLRSAGAGTFRTSRQDAGAGVEYEHLERDSLGQRWERADLLAVLQGSSGRSLGAGLSSQLTADRQRQVARPLRLGWGGSTGLVFRRLEAVSPYAWASSLRGEAQLQAGARLYALQRVEVSNQTGSGIRQGLSSLTDLTWSPVSPLWLQSGLRATRDLQPLRRTSADWISSLTWPFSPRLSWITELTITYLGNVRPLGRRAQSTLELNLRRLHFMLEGRYERLTERRNLGAFVSLTRTIGG